MSLYCSYSTIQMMKLYRSSYVIILLFLKKCAIFIAFFVGAIWRRTLSCHFKTNASRMTLLIKMSKHYTTLWMIQNQENEEKHLFSNYPWMVESWFVLMVNKFKRICCSEIKKNVKGKKNHLGDVAFNFLVKFTNLLSNVRNLPKPFTRKKQFMALKVSVLTL